MPREEMEYYESRAEAELQLAQQAAHCKAVQAHYQLAAAYLDLIHGDTPVAAPNLLSR
jgi:hypothetical protein